MKKLLAILLALLLAVSLAFAEEAQETSLEEAFTRGADELLDSVDLERDMLTLTMTEGNQTYRCHIAQADNTIAFSLDGDGTVFEAQIMEDQIYANFAGTVVNLKYADLEAMMNSAAGAVDMQAMAELFQPLLTRVILPHVNYDGSDGIRVSYAATGKELLTDLAGYLDEVLADEKYYPAIDQLLSYLSTLSGSQLPTAAQLAQMWPESKESLLAQDPDFHVNFDLTANAAFTAVDITAEIGASNDLYLMDWAFRVDGTRLSLTGRLAERITTGEETRDYDITIDAEYNSGLWSLAIRYPSRMFTLEAEGSHTETAERFSLYLNSRGRRPANIRMQGSCTRTDEGMTGQLHFADAYGNSFDATLLVDEETADICVIDFKGTKVFALKALQDDDRLAYAKLEINDQRSSTSLTAVYDGEKVIVNSNGEEYLVTWAYESDHEFVLTVHPQANEDASGDVLVRASYEGEPGNFTMTMKVFASDGSEALNMQLVCEPTQGIGAPLSEREGILYLTPEVMQSLMQQMMK